MTRIVTDALNLANPMLDVAFVGDQRIRTLNREFRRKDKTTDVLSFPQVAWLKPARVSAARGPSTRQGHHPGKIAAEPLHLGDVVISVATAAKNARLIRQALDREVCFLLVHGILHLCGHDHMTPDEDRIMRGEQRKLLARLAVSAPGKTPLWRNCVRQRRARELSS